MTGLPSAQVRLPAAARRQQLLEVALEVFGTRGFDATSMDDLAEAAGITKPVLYQHFRSKRALYLELLDAVGAKLLAAVGEATSAAEGPRQQVEAGFTAYFRFVADQTTSFRLLFGSGAQRHADFDAEVRRVEAIIAAAVADLIEADIDPVHRQLLAYAVVGMAEGVGRHWLLTGGTAVDGAVPASLDPERTASRIADLVWAGLRVVHRD